MDLNKKIGELREAIKKAYSTGTDLRAACYRRSSTIFVRISTFTGRVAVRAAGFT
jgi:hypothetical protein